MARKNKIDAQKTGLSSSPERFTFQKTRYLERQAEEGKTPENDDNVKFMLDYYKTHLTSTMEKESDPEWKENNMEYDLRSCAWMLQKVRDNDNYAQNLYAAMCNNEFQKNDFILRLKDKTWSCSWRYAGGIIADMQENGDYIDWYCSGIRNHPIDEDLSTMDDAQLAAYERTCQYVSESVVTDEIRSDLKKLGWLVLEDNKEMDI